MEKLVVGALVLGGCLAANAAGVPAEYRQVDWIESSAAQRIDTGIVAGPTTSVYCAFRETTVSATRNIFGVAVGGKNTYSFGINNSSVLQFAGAPTTFVKPKAANEFVFETDAETGTATLTTDGVAGTPVSVSLENTDGRTTPLFAPYSGNASWTRMSSFRVWQQEDGKKVLVCDLVPAVCIETGVAGMYDVVRNVFLPDCSGSTKPFAVPLGFAIDAIPAQVLDGKSACEPLPVVRDTATGKVLVKDADYTLSYSKNTDYGVGSVRVAGLPGTDYAGMWTDVSFGVVHAFGGLVAYYVSPDGTADADCSDWDHAGTLSNACARAASATSALAPNVILLKSGTAEDPAVYDYSGLVGAASVDVNVAVLAANNVTVRSEDGNPTNCIIRGAVENDIRCLKVTGSSVRIEGITIERFGKSGHSGGAVSAALGFGAAVFAKNGTVYSNCVFRANCGNEVASVHEGAAHCCSFICNTNAQVSGWHVGGVSYLRSSFGCYFSGNKGVNCSGIQIIEAGVTVRDCLFEGNFGAAAAQAYNNNYGLVTNCVFRNNFCPGTSVQTVRNCWYVNNTCEGGKSGSGSGGIDGSAGNVNGAVYDSMFISNRCTSSTHCAAGNTRGGKYYRCVFTGAGNGSNGFAIGDAAYYDCVFTNNTCSRWFYRQVTLEGCLIANNVLKGAMEMDINFNTQANWGWRVRDDYQAKTKVYDNNFFISNRIDCSLAISSGRLRNWLFKDNYVTNGMNTQCSLFRYGTAINCTFIDNDLGSGAASGAVSTQTSQVPTLLNCLFWNNQPVDICPNYGQDNRFYVIITNCVYGTKTENKPFRASWSNDVVRLTRCKFLPPDETHPYGGLPRYVRQPAIVDAVRGEYARYFDETSLDLSFTNRQYGAAIDIGCYEAHPGKGGLLLLVK